MKKSVKAFCILMTAVVMLPLFGFAASGNSAQTQWTGTTASGVTVVEEDCPLVVERELLTFDVSAFPSKEYYEDGERAGAAAAAYAAKAKVTAEYTFFNPALYDVTATLAFPFGKMPDYYDGANGVGGAWGASIDGEAAATRLRHTYAGDRYRNDVDLPRLVNGYKTDPFFTPDLPVTFFSYVYVSDKQDGWDEVGYTVYKDPGTRFSCPWNSIDDLGDRYAFSAALYARSSDRTLDFVFFGKAPEGIDFEGLHEGEMRRLPEKTRMLTLRELAFENYDPTCGVPDSDWYNAFVDGLLEDEKRDPCRYGVERDLRSELLSWYEYEMTVPAGGRVVNSVTAPLFPTIDGDYDPPVFSYEYLLSPAATWADFGELEVVLNTPFYRIDGNFGALSAAGEPAVVKKTEGGFSCTYKGLPKGELTFRLSSDPSPRDVSRANFVKTVLLLALYFLCLFLIVVGIFALVTFIVLKKRPKKQ